MSITGVVKSGVGEGAFFMSLQPYHDQMTEKLGFPPFKGTLNLDVDKQKAERFIAALDKIEIDGFTMGDKIFGKVDCHPCTLNDVQGALIVPQYTRYDLSTLEFIAKDNLRGKLNIKDGDEVTLEP